MPEQLNELMHVSNWFVHLKQPNKQARKKKLIKKEKKRLNDFQGRVRQVQAALNELLNSDEDMALMSISDPQK